MRGQFLKEYWSYRKEGGELSMKDYATQKKSQKKEDTIESSQELKKEGITNVPPTA